MLTINTNLSSLIAQGSMKSSTNKLNQAIERMTTGFKINHAKDNAANYSISTNMTTKLNAYDVAADNCAMGMDLVTTASDTVSLMQDKAERLRTLCTQARNGTYGGGKSRQAISAEANAIMAEINRIYSTAQYNGVSLFTGENNSSEAVVAEMVSEETAPIVKLAMARTMAAADTEASFISDPITYSNAEVKDMTTITEAIASGSLVSGGTYSISTVEELVTFANLVNNGRNTSGMTFVLGADIDLSTIENWTPIGNNSYKFVGIFDGNGHTISNLKINSSDDYQGLFGYVGKSSFASEIKNLGLENVNVVGGNRVGALAGNSDTVTISNCYSTGIVSGVNYVGGFVGDESGDTLTKNCYSTATVNGSQYVGGFVGDHYGIIDNCYATGGVSGVSRLGGFVGNSSPSVPNLTITNCYATGNVQGTGGNVGGFIGYNNITNTFYAVTISNCYATGDVFTRGERVGGFVGYTSGTNIANCYATGKTSGSNRYVGGFAGMNNGASITNCYSTGNVQGNSTTSYSIKNSSDWDGTQFAYNYGVASYSKNLESVFDEIVDEEVDEDKYDDINNDNSINSEMPRTHFLLQIGINSDSSCQIGFDINFTFDLSAVGADISSDEALNAIDNFIIQLSEYETKLGAVQNRLESVLEEITIQRDNLVSSRSTIRDADIAEVSSHYIQQQILQQASATLLATANQSPSIALQLI